MAAGTGGSICRDTGNGLTSLTLIRGSAAVQNNEQMTAYQVYLAHPQTCPDCPERTFRCDEAARLYEAYRQVCG